MPRRTKNTAEIRRGRPADGLNTDNLRAGLPPSSGHIQDSSGSGEPRARARLKAKSRKANADQGLLASVLGDTEQAVSAVANHFGERVIAGYTGLKTNVQAAVDRLGRFSFSTFFIRSNTTLREMDKLRLHLKDPTLQMSAFEINRNIQEIQERTEFLRRESANLRRRGEEIQLELNQPGTTPEATARLRAAYDELIPKILQRDREQAAFDQYQRYFEEQAAKARPCQLMVCDALPEGQELFSLIGGNAAQVFVLTADKLYFVNRIYRRCMELPLSPNSLREIRDGFGQSPGQIPLPITDLARLAELTRFNPMVNDDSDKKRAPGLALVFVDQFPTRENLRELQVAPPKAYVCAEDGLYYVDQPRRICTKILSGDRFSEWLDASFPENQRFGTKSLSAEAIEQLTRITGFRRSADAAASSSDTGLSLRAFDEISYATASEQEHPHDVYQDLDVRHIAWLLHKVDKAKVDVETLYEDMDSATSPWRNLPWYIHVAHAVFKFFGETTVSVTKGLREAYRADELVPREYDFHMDGQAVFKQLTERVNREHFSDEPEIQDIFDAVLARNEASNIGDFRILSLKQEHKDGLIAFIDGQIAARKREQGRIKTTGFWASLFGRGPSVSKAQATAGKKSHQLRIDFLRQLRADIKSAPRDVLDEFYTNFLRQPQRDQLQKDLAKDFKEKLAQQLNQSRAGTTDERDYSQLFSVDEVPDSVDVDKILRFLSDDAVALDMQARVIRALSNIINDMKQRLPKITWTDNKTKELAEKQRYIAALELLQQQYMLNRQHVPFNITADIKIVEEGDPTTRDARRARGQLTLSEEFIELYNQNRQNDAQIKLKPSMIQRDPYAFHDLCNSHLGNTVLNTFMDYYVGLEGNEKIRWNDLLGITPGDLLESTGKPRFFGDGISHGGIEARTELAHRFVAAFIKPVDLVLNDEQWAERLGAFRAFLTYLQENLPSEARESQAYALVTRCVHSIDSNELTVRQLLIEHQKSLLPPFGEAANVLFRKGQGHEATDYVKRILARAIRRAKAILDARMPTQLAERENDEKLLYGLELALAIIEGRLTFHRRGEEASVSNSLATILGEQDAQDCLNKVLIPERMLREGDGETPAQFLVNRYMPRHITPLLTAYRSPDVSFGKLPGKMEEVISHREQLNEYISLIRQVNGELGSKRLANLVDEIAIDGMKALRSFANERNGLELSLEINQTLVPLTILHDDPGMAVAIEAVIDQYLYGNMQGHLTGVADDVKAILLSLGRIVYQPDSFGYMTYVDEALIQRVRDFWMSSGQIGAERRETFLTYLNGDAQSLVGTLLHINLISAALQSLGVNDEKVRKAITGSIAACKRPFAFYDGRSGRYASLLFMLGSKEQQAAWAGMRFKYLLQTGGAMDIPGQDAGGDSFTDKSFLDFFVKNEVQPKFADAAIAVKTELERVTVEHAKDTTTAWSEQAHELVEFYCDNITKQFHRFKRVMEFIDPARSSVKAYDDAQRLYGADLNAPDIMGEKAFLQRIQGAGALGGAGKPFDLEGDFGVYMRGMLTQYLDVASAHAPNGQPWFQVAEEYFSVIAPDDLVEKLRLKQFRYLLLEASSHHIPMGVITAQAIAYKRLIEGLDRAQPCLRLCDVHKVEALDILSNYISTRQTGGSTVERYMGHSVEAVPFLCLVGNVAFEEEQLQRCRSDLDAWLDKRMGHLFASDENLIAGKHTLDESFLEHFLLSESGQQRHAYATILQNTFDKHVELYLGKALPWNSTASALIERFASPKLVQLYRIRRLTELLAQGFDFAANEVNDGLFPNGFIHIPGVPQYLVDIQQRSFGINSLFDVTDPEVFAALLALLNTHLAALNASPHVEKWSITSEAIFTVIAKGTGEPQLLAPWASLRLNKVAYHLDTEVRPYVQTQAVSMQTHKAEKALGYPDAIVDDAMGYADEVRGDSPESGMSLPQNNDRRTQIFMRYVERFDGKSLEFVPLAVLIAPTDAKIMWLNRRFEQLANNQFKLEALDKTFFEHIHSNADPVLTAYFNDKIQKLIYNADDAGEFVSWTEHKWTGGFHALVARYATSENRDAHSSKYILSHLNQSLSGEDIRKPYSQNGALAKLVQADAVRGGFCERGQVFLRARIDAFLVMLGQRTISSLRWHLATEQIIAQLVRAGEFTEVSLLERDDLERIQALRIAELLHAPRSSMTSRRALAEEYVTFHMCERARVLQGHFDTPRGESALKRVLENYVQGLELNRAMSHGPDNVGQRTFDFAEHAEYLFVSFAQSTELELLRRQKIKELLHVDDINKSIRYKEILRTFDRPNNEGSRVSVVFSGLLNRTDTGAKDLDDVFDAYQTNYPWSENAEFLIESFGSAERLDLYHVKRFEELIKLEASGATHAIVDLDRFLRQLKSYGIDNLVTTVKGKEAFEELLTRYLAEDKETNMAIAVLLTHYYPQGEAAPLRRQYNLKRMAELLLQQKPYFKCDSRLLPDDSLIFADEAENYWLAASNDVGNIDLAKARFGQVLHTGDVSRSPSLSLLGLQQVLASFCDWLDDNIAECSNDTINVLASLHHRAWMKDCLGETAGEAFYVRVQQLINRWEQVKGRKEDLRAFRTAVRDSQYEEAKRFYQRSHASSSSSSSQAVYVTQSKQVLATFEQAANAEMIEKVALLSRVLLSLTAGDNGVRQLTDSVMAADSLAAFSDCMHSAKTLQPLLDVELSTTLRSPITYLAQLDLTRRAFCEQNIPSLLGDNAAIRLPEIGFSIDVLSAGIVTAGNRATAISHIKEYVNLVAIIESKLKQRQDVSSRESKALADAMYTCYVDFLKLQALWVHSRLKRMATDYPLQDSLVQSICTTLDNGGGVASLDVVQLRPSVLSVISTLLNALEPTVATQLTQKLYALFERKLHNSDEYVRQLAQKLQSCARADSNSRSQALMSVLTEESITLMEADHAVKVKTERSRLSALSTRNGANFVRDIAATLSTESFELTLINIQSQFKPLRTHNESATLQRDIDEATQTLLVHFGEVQRLVSDRTLWRTAFESLNDDAKFESLIARLSAKQAEKTRRIRVFLTQLKDAGCLDSITSLDRDLVEISANLANPNSCTSEKESVFAFIKAYVKELEGIYGKSFNVAYTMAHASSVAAISAKVRNEITRFIKNRSTSLSLSAEDGIVLIRCLDRRARQQLIKTLNKATSSMDVISRGLAEHFAKALASGDERSKATKLFLFYHELAKLKANITESELTVDFFKAVEANIYSIIVQLSKEEKDSIISDLCTLGASNGFIKEVCDYVISVLEGQPLAGREQVDVYLARFATYKAFSDKMKEYREANIESSQISEVESDFVVDMSSRRSSSVVDLRSISSPVVDSRLRNSSVADLSSKSGSTVNLRSRSDSATDLRLRAGAWHKAREKTVRSIRIPAELLDRLSTVASETPAVKAAIQKDIADTMEINTGDYLDFLRPLVVQLGTPEQQNYLTEGSRWDKHYDALDAFLSCVDKSDKHEAMVAADHWFAYMRDLSSYTTILAKLRHFMAGILKPDRRSSGKVPSLSVISLLYIDKLVAKGELPPKQMDFYEALMGFEPDECSKTPADRTLTFIQRVLADERLTDIGYKTFYANIASLLVGMLCKDPSLIKHAVFHDLAGKLELQLDDTYTEFNSVRMIAAIRDSLQEGENARLNVEAVIESKRKAIVEHLDRPTSEGMYTVSQMLFEPLFMLGLTFGSRSFTLRCLAEVPAKAIQLRVAGQDEMGRDILVGFRGDTKHPLGLIADSVGLRTQTTAVVDASKGNIWGHQSAQWYRLTSFLGASDLVTKLELLGISMTKSKISEVAAIQKAVGEPSYLSKFTSARDGIAMLMNDLNAAVTKPEPQDAIRTLLIAKGLNEVANGDGQAKVDIVKGLMSLYRSLLLGSAITQAEYEARLETLNNMDAKIAAFEMSLSMPTLSSEAQQTVEQLLEDSMLPSPSSSSSSSSSYSVTAGPSNFFPPPPETGEQPVSPASSPRQERRGILNSFVRNAGFAHNPESVLREVGGEEEQLTSTPTQDSSGPPRP